MLKFKRRVGINAMEILCKQVRLGLAKGKKLLESSAKKKKMSVSIK